MSARADSLLALTRRLLSVRRQHPALHRGCYRPVDDMPAGTFVFRRTHEDDRLLVLVNFEAKPVRVPLGDRVRDVLASTHPGAAIRSQSAFDLRPHEGVILELLP